MGLAVRVAVLPLGGPFHTRWPRYNAEHVRADVAGLAPDVVALAPLAPGDLEDPRWQDTEEIALPLTVVPWATTTRTPVYGVGLGPDDRDDPGSPGAEADLRRYLEMYEDGMGRLRSVDAAEAAVAELLAKPLDRRQITDDLLPLVERLDGLRTDLLGRGPGDGWREERAHVIVGRALAAARAVAEDLDEERPVVMALLAGIDQLPSLRRALSSPAADASGAAVELVEAPFADAGEAGRQRALLDAALIGRGEPAALLDALGELRSAEARYHRANLLLELGRSDEALREIDELVNGDFSSPYFLPGFALARRGQMMDLADRRDDAVRSYRGVLALSYAPVPALEAAREGLEAPFALQVREEGA